MPQVNVLDVVVDVKADVVAAMAVDVEDAHDEEHVWTSIYTVHFWRKSWCRYRWSGGRNAGWHTC